MSVARPDDPAPPGSPALIAKSGGPSGPRPPTSCGRQSPSTPRSRRAGRRAEQLGPRRAVPCRDARSDALAGGRDRRRGRGRRGRPARSVRGLDRGDLDRPAVPGRWADGPMRPVEGRCSDLVAVPPATADGHALGRPQQRPVGLERGERRRRRVAGTGRAGRVQPRYRALDQRRLERRRALADRQRAGPERRAGRRAPAADGPRAADRPDAGRGRDDGPPTRPGLVLQHGLRSTATGRVADVEGSATDAALVGATDGAGRSPTRTTTSAPRMLGYEGDPAYARSSAVRYRRALALLDEATGTDPGSPGTVTPEALRSMLADHATEPVALPAPGARTATRPTRSPSSGRSPTSRPGRSATASADPCEPGEERYRFD